MEKLDIVLAELSGWKARVPPPADEEVVELERDPDTGEVIRPNCDYLTDAGCSFPKDLMPYGCTAYICRYMYEEMNKMQLNRIRRLIRNMDDQYRILQKTQKGR